MLLQPLSSTGETTTVKIEAKPDQPNEHKIAFHSQQSEESEARDALVVACPDRHFVRPRGRSGGSETASRREFFLFLRRPAISGVEKDRGASSCEQPTDPERVLLRH